MADALRRRNAELSALNAIGQALTSSLDLPEILGQALEVLLGGLNYRSASIVLLDWDTQEVEVHSRRRAGDHIESGLRRFDLLSSAPAATQGASLSTHVIAQEQRPPPGPGWLLAVPVAARGCTLGMLAATVPANRRSLLRGRHMLGRIGGQLGLAVEQARLYDRARLEADRLAALNAVGSAVRRSMRVPELLRQALEQMLAVTDLELGLVSLCSAEAGHSSVAARSGLSRPLAERLSMRAREACGDLRHPSAGGEPHTEENLPATAAGRTPRARAPRCLMHIPLRSPARTLGILTLGSCTQRHFAPGAAELLVGMASQVSLALENAQLYEQTRSDAQRLEAIHAVATAANQTLEIEPFLRTALAKLVEVAGLRGAAVLLLDRREGVLLQVGYRGDAASPLGELGRLPIPVPAGDPVACESACRGRVEGQSGGDQMPVLYQALLSKGRLLGMLVAAPGRAAAKAETGDLLQALAAQVAIALDNALLYAETQHRAAELAEANAALREALRGKDQFLANVTHELKRPLAPARLVLETLLETPPAGLGPGRREKLLRNALGNLDSMNALVSELLDAVRLQRRPAQPAAEACDLRRISRRSIAAMRPLARARHLRIQVIVPSAAVPVRGDPAALARVVANLLSNACKFNREGGSILVQLETGDGRAVLSVSDTGVGIPAHARPHIFERFYQADGSSKRAHEGLGLGLFIAKEIVEQHGGQIRFDTEEGVGTTFTVVLPLA